MNGVFSDWLNISFFITEYSTYFNIYIICLEVSYFSLRQWVLSSLRSFATFVSRMVITSGDGKASWARAPLVLHFLFTQWFTFTRNFRRELHSQVRFFFFSILLLPLLRDATHVSSSSWLICYINIYLFIYLSTYSYRRYRNDEAHDRLLHVLRASFDPHCPLHRVDGIHRSSRALQRDVRRLRWEWTSDAAEIKTSAPYS